MGKEVAKIVKERMQSLGLTYEQAAERAGISRPYLAKIIQGTRNPDHETALKLAEALQIDKKELLFIALREQAPEEAKEYFEPALIRIRWIGVYNKLRDLMSDWFYAVEDRYSRKYVEFAKKLTPQAKKAIERVERKKGFISQIRETNSQVENYFMKKSEESPQEEKRAVRLMVELEQLLKAADAYRRNDPIRVELPLLTADGVDPRVAFRKYKRFPRQWWKLTFERRPELMDFAYQVPDDSMVPLIRPGDTLIVSTERIKGFKALIGKIVIIRVKGLGVVVRHYNRKEKNVVLTALNPSFPPHILSHSEIEWLYPVKGVYREL